MALSDDDRMGSDSVIECVNENNNIQTFTSYTHIGITEEDFRSSRADVVRIISRMESFVMIGPIIMILGPKYH